MLQGFGISVGYQLIMVKNSELSSFQCLQGIVLICQISCLMQILFLTKKVFSAAIQHPPCDVSGIQNSSFRVLTRNPAQEIQDNSIPFLLPILMIFQSSSLLSVCSTMKNLQKMTEESSRSFQGVIKMFMSVYQGGMT